MDKLIDDIYKKKQTLNRESIINKIKNLYYCSIGQLIADLKIAGYEDIINNIKCGKYSENLL